MQPIAENLWLLHYPLKVLGTNHGRNVTVIRLASGRLIIHSMAPFTPADLDAIRARGEPAWLVEAMLFHDTYAREGRVAFPGLPFLGPPDFDKVTGLTIQPLVPPPPEWDDEIEVLPIEGAPKLEEHAILHRPSRTLIVADLVVNFGPDERGWEHFFHRHIAGFKRYPGTSRIFKLCITDRPTFRASITRLLERDFDRLIVGHGHIIEHNAKSLLKRALTDAHLLQ